MFGITDEDWKKYREPILKELNQRCQDIDLVDHVEINSTKINNCLKIDILVFTKPVLHTPYIFHFPIDITNQI
jgi:hypothetical protein